MAETSFGLMANKHVKMICWLSARVLLGEILTFDLAVKNEELASDLV